MFIVATSVSHSVSLDKRSKLTLLHLAFGLCFVAHTYNGVARDFLKSYYSTET